MVYTPDRVESIAPVFAEEERCSGRIQATAQLELESYLEEQVRSIAPARIDSLSLVDGYTYLSVMDEDRPITKQPIYLIIQLEDCQGNEQLVDLVTNNDRFAFITRIIRNHFDACWQISETWTPEDGCPF
ncbi:MULTISPECIES: hypothetical protein [Trichocoleus]|uniref:Uncharacterized protein n=1 Tax=Trichocoleus desertorum GB2-A4 TaxID=2933944 RepID=A0ABV0JDZ9_9CYAN|nr:hypothetical protein [Trichocoleus sp. FACHB-46]MBD1865195.1 hypothetical protein [Trichocoleus sp. FACHB-46]